MSSHAAGRITAARRRILLVLVLLLPATACEVDEGPPVLPTAEQASAFYDSSANVRDVHLSGNVVVVEVLQPPRQLRRGGSLWAKVGPYVYLFSPGTRELFRQFADVAAVRVVTYGPGDVEVARALLMRDTLSEIQWRRSLNLLGHALNEGTRQPSRLEDLVVWGEQYARYSYNPEFLPN